MLDDARLKSDAKYHKVIHKFARDPRYRVLDEKKRENYF